MALTLDNRRQTIAETYAIVVDLIDELEEDSPNVNYVRAGLGSLRSHLEIIDRDGPAPASIATTIVEAIEAITRETDCDEFELIHLRKNAVEQAVTVDNVDAIPGIYPYRSKIVTFVDGSQCYIPAEGQPASEPLYGLVERYEVLSYGLIGDSLPRVLDPDAVLAPEEAARLLEVRSKTYSDNTNRAYRAQWNAWVAYASKRGIRLLSPPASQISAWVTHRSDNEGARPSTILLGLQALKAIHSECGQPHACDDPEVQATMRGIKRESGLAPNQVTGISHEVIEDIEASVYRRRIGRGGKRETVEGARRRGDMDIAIVRLLFDALLRPSELTGIRWLDLERHGDGSGTIKLRKGKTDRFGFGRDLFIPPITVEALLRIRGDAAEEDRIVALSARTVARRVKKAVVAAGLTGRYAGHSGRVGMAQTLAAEGAELPEIMEAGRWKSEGMVPYYIRKQRASRSRVAKMYREQANGDNQVGG